MLGETDQFHIVGVALMVIAAALFALSKTSGSLKAKLFGQEVELTAPSLAFLLAGVGVFIFPHTSLYVDRSKAVLVDSSSEANAVGAAENAAEVMTNNSTIRNAMAKDGERVTSGWQLEPDDPPRSDPDTVPVRPPPQAKVEPVARPVEEQQSPDQDEPIVSVIPIEDEPVQVVQPKGN